MAPERTASSALEGELRAAAGRLARSLHQRWQAPDGTWSAEQGRELNRLALQGGEHSLAVLFAGLLGIAQLAENDAKGAVQIAGRTLALVEDPKLRALFGIAHARLGRSNEALTAYERAVRALDAGAATAGGEESGGLGIARLRSVILGAWGLDAARRGRLREAAELVEHDLDAERGRGAPGELGRSLLAKAHVALERNEVGAADQAIEEALALFRERPQSRELASAMEMKARVLSRRKSIGEAIRLREAALEIVRRERDRQGELIVLAGLSGNLLARGQTDDARELCLLALGIARDLEDRVAEAGILYSLGELELRADRPREGEARLLESIEVATAAAAPRITLFALHELARLDAARGALDRARRSHERLLPLVEGMGDPLFHRAVLVDLAAVLDALGRPEEAAARRREAEAVPGVREDA